MRTLRWCSIQAENNHLWSATRIQNEKNFVQIGVATNSLLCLISDTVEVVKNEESIVNQYWISWMASGQWTVLSVQSAVERSGNETPSLIIIFLSQSGCNWWAQFDYQIGNLCLLFKSIYLRLFKIWRFGINEWYQNRMRILGVSLGIVEIDHKLNDK